MPSAALASPQTDGSKSHTYYRALVVGGIWLRSLTSSLGPPGVRQQGEAGGYRQDCEPLSCQWSRSGPASAGCTPPGALQVPVIGMDVAAGFTLEGGFQPMDFIDSSFISENKRELFNLCRCKGEPGG